MSEDLSAYVRAALTIFMCAALVASVLNVTVIANTSFRAWATAEIAMLHTADESIRLSISNSDWMTAPMAYKYVSGSESKIRSVSISYLDSVTTADPDTLLEHAMSYVEIEILPVSGGLYDVYIMEVQR